MCTLVDEAFKIPSVERFPGLRQYVQVRWFDGNRSIPELSLWPDFEFGRESV